MKLEDKLKNIDSETLGKEFPADWDTDKIFEKSYKKYLSMKNNQGIKASESNFKISSVEKVSSDSRIKHILLDMLPIAACFAVIWGMTKLMSMPPVPVEYDSKPENSDTPPPLSSETAESAEQNDIYTDISETVIINDKTELYSDTYTEYEPDFSDNAESVRNTENHIKQTDSEPAYIPPPASENTAEPEQPDITEAVTESTVIVAKPTDIPQNTETEGNIPPSDTVPLKPEDTEPQHEAPGFDPVPTDTAFAPEPPPDEAPYEPSENPSSPDSCGYFEQVDSPYNDEYRCIIFNPPSVPPEPVEHHLSYEGFTTELLSDAYNITSYRLTDDSTGQVYIVTINKLYEWFTLSYSKKLDYFVSIFPLNSRSAFYVYEDNETKLGTLGFDDGCHVVTIVSQHKDYNTMFYLAENFN